MTINQRLPFPRVVRIEPAAKCNLTCSHCPTGTVDMERGLMNDVVFERVLAEIKENIASVKVIVLYHGGEPLLNKKFYSMATEIRALSSDFYIKTVTNGMSLNERNISKFLECDFNEVEISLDGLSPAESQEIRVKSDSRKIIRNIKQLIRARDKISSSLKISISTTQFLRARADIEYPEKLIPVTPDWLTDELPDTVNFKPYLAMRWPHMNVDKQYELVYVNGEDRNYCDHPVNTITIRYNGDIVPCCYDLTSQLLMGNIMHKSLLGIFNGDKYRSLRSSIEEKKYKPLCMNCNLVRPQVYLVKPEIPISTN